MSRTDRELLAAHLDGDGEAFGLLFARHRDRLWAVALRTTGDRDEAADALQDAVVAAWRRAGSYRGESAVTTWLHRIVVNACLDRLRRNRVRAAEPLPEDAAETSGPGAAVVASVDPAARRAAGPEESAVAAEVRERVLRALETLPPDQRAALVLVDMEGYSVAEAAEVLDAPEGTVKSRCARGRVRLVDELADLVDRDGLDRDGLGQDAGEQS